MTSHDHAWTLNESEYQLWLLNTKCQAESLAADESLVLSCHPDKIPSSDSKEVRNEKIKRFCNIGQWNSKPNMSLREAFVVWGTTIMKAFHHSNPDENAAISLIGSLGIPALMISMGGAEHGGRLCMTFALMLFIHSKDSLAEEFRRMSEEDLRIMRQALLILDRSS